MPTETEAAIEFTRRHLERSLFGNMNELELEIQIRLEFLTTGLLGPTFPDACDVTMINFLVERAVHGEVAADKQLRVAAIMLMEAQKPMPWTLIWYLTEILREAPPRKRKLANQVRDQQICFAILHLVENGYRPTRNEASRGSNTESASSIVSAAFQRMGRTISEDAIDKIWQKSDNLLGAFRPSAMARKNRQSNRRQPSPPMRPS